MLKNANNQLDYIRNTSNFVGFILFTFFNLIVLMFFLYDLKFYYFSVSLVSSNFIIFTKLVILLTSFFILILCFFYSNYEENFNLFEFYFLFFLSIFSMFFLISCNDFLNLYLIIELQTLIFYILAAFKQNSILSIEAALKYFILGTFSSAILLYGVSFIYGYTGTLNFLELNSLFQNSTMYSLNKFFSLGVLFFLFALMFKVTAAPFHMWGPDVYQGAPTLVTFFFSLTPKLVFLFFLIRLSISLNSILQPWSSFVFFSCGIFSLILGSFSSIAQVKIKRLLAYSSISNVGYFLIALSTNHFEGFVTGIFFIIIYIFILTALFSILIASRYFINNLKIKNISDFFSLITFNLPISLCLLFSFFSLLGLPPFAGFFSKFYLFLVILSSDFFFLLFFGIFSSILSAFIYLRIVRLSFFNKSFIISFFTPISPFNSFIIMFCVLFNFLIFFDSDFFF